MNSFSIKKLYSLKSLFSLWGGSISLSQRYRGRRRGLGLYNVLVVIVGINQTLDSSIQRQRLVLEIDVDQTLCEQSAFVVPFLIFEPFAFFPEIIEHLIQIGGDIVQVQTGDINVN